MKFRYIISIAISLLILGAVNPEIRADDIDIYIDPAEGTGTEPIVMFTLDYRSNLGSTVCSGGACDFLTSKTYTNNSGATVPYLTLSGGTTSRFNLLRGVLKYVLQQVGPSGVRIGFAMNHENNNNCEGPSRTGCSNGGYIISEANSRTTQAGRDAYYAKLDALPIPGGTVAHPYQGKELFFELFRYFSGQGWYNMKNGWKDRGTNNSYNVNQADDYSPADATIPASWDAGIISGSNYISPVSNSCTKLFTVNVIFEVTQNEDDSDNAITASAASGGMGGINLSGNNNKFSTVIRWMYDNDAAPGTSGRQSVTSYFIVDSSKVNTTTRGYAGAGQGLSSADPYVLSDDPETLINTLTRIFTNILSVSTSFVAPSVAVNVYNRAQVRDEVYIAMFQAPDTGVPAWPGNLKRYKMTRNADGYLEIQDSASTYAVASDGRIDFGALSFWTISGDLPAPGTSDTDILAAKDGRRVSRGGTGSKIPGFKLKCTSGTDTSCYPGDYSPGLTNASGDTTNVTARKLFTQPTSYTNGTATAMRALNADVSTATALQSNLSASSVGTCAYTDTDATSACNLLIYARGGNFVDHDNNGGTPPELRARSWILGDLLHSRPLTINYGARTGSSYTADNPDIRIVAGSNDGFMHMFRNTREGGAPAPNADAYDGVETWGFMPLDAMPTIKTLKANTVVSPRHPYTVDGAPAAYILDWNGNGNIESPDADGKYDKVYLYFGLRRGGKAYYALDVTDPDDPKFLWKIARGDTGFEELGQTWSTPKIAMMLYGGSTTSAPVLIFGGGYDTDKDTHIGHGSYTSTGIGSDDSEGNALFIVNAETGALVWKAVKGASEGYNSASKTYTHPSLKDSIPSDVKLVDSDGNELIDRVYVGDTGGMVWRVDMRCKNQDGSGCTEGGWKITPILSVGRHVSGWEASVANDRRFFSAPAYAQQTDGTGNFDAIMIGAGDRENPKDTTVTNWFYMFKDRSVNSGTPPTDLRAHSNLGDVSSDCLQMGTCAGSPPDLTYGWRLKLECPPDFPSTCGEKNLAPAVTLSGAILFTTYRPPASMTEGCGLTEGNGLFYSVSIENASAIENFYTPNDTGGTVLAKLDRATELASGGIPSDPVVLGTGSGGSGSGGCVKTAVLRPDLKVDDKCTAEGYNTYWYEKYKK